ncbi:tetratricopeptide repeat protein [Streptomyces sp. HUAS ZL42]|uniref:tetratricopeptide repeat protein n=1 Tax=Streptomyces sp. HUAS ZL42 TaxID=3231715 RepID=UPI00345E8E6B
MSRLSRDKKREENYAASSAGPVVAPLDVSVTGEGPGAVGASIGGVPVVAAPGQEIQQAVLSHLHRIALATGHPVLATVHDERIGYVVHLRVDMDGSSHFTAEPVRAAAPEEAGPEGARAEATAPSESPAASVEPPRPHHDKPTHVLRPVHEPVHESMEEPVRESMEAAVREPVRDATPTFPLRSLPEPHSAGDPAPTFALRAVSEGPEKTAAAGPVPPAPMPGTVAAPTGEFGPPPAMDAEPEATFAPVPVVTGKSTAHRESDLAAGLNPGPEPDPKPTPARGFDAVAEAVLGDEPLTAPGDGSAPALLAEPMGRINEAVKAGRIETAAALAEQTVGEASQTLGPEHPEVLRLRELTAYIAYLAGDPLRSFHLSLDLARIRRRTRDAEAAYGNVQSAAAAWRAVRDPVQGLALGCDLLGLWTELTAEGGPAAEDVEQLESARTRMGRLAERARAAEAQ